MKIYIASAALAVAFLTGPVSYAASFDCTKATTSVEQAICRDSTLDALDTKLGRVYKESRRHLSDDARNQSLRNQRAWSASLAKVCTPSSAEDQKYLTECLATQMQERMDYLNSLQTRVAGLYRYPALSKEGGIPIELLDGYNEDAKYVNGVVKKLAAEFTVVEDQFGQDTITIEPVSDSLVSITFVYRDWRLDDRSRSYFDLKTKKQIQAADLFKKASLDQMAKLAFKRLKQNYGSDELKCTAGITPDEIKGRMTTDLTSLRIHSSGLDIQLGRVNQFCHDVSVTLDAASLRPFVSEYYGSLLKDP